MTLNERLKQFFYIKTSGRLIRQTNTNAEVYEKDGLYYVYVFSAIGSEYKDAHLIARVDNLEKAHEVADAVVW